MFLVRRHWLGAAAGMALAASLAASPVACSSSSGASSEPAPTLVTVSPATFGQGVLCGNFPGAWKTYVATLTDVTDPNAPFVLASSNPVPCAMPVSFAWVIPGHEYVASIQGYDRDDLVPYGGTSSGSPHMVDPSTEQDVTARWETECGMPSESSSEGSDADGGALPQDASVNATEPTLSFLQSNVLMKGCAPLREIRTGEVDTGITLNLSTLRGDLTCGQDPGQVDRLRVIPDDPSLAPLAGDCDETLTFVPVQPNRGYRFRVEAFEAAGTLAAWATTCQAHSKQGIILPAACDPLSNRGALRIDIASLLSAAQHQCGPQDVVSYQAVLLGGSLPDDPRACTSNALFNALVPASYQAVVDGFDAQGDDVFNAFCEGAVVSAEVTTMTCQVGPS